MIFVTVGAQMPFDRLVDTVDQWAERRGRGDVFAQIGPTDWRPRCIAWTQFLPPAEFRQRVASASAIVAHAGMGSILTSLELGKPILVMPRRGALRETRNDHQVATARQLADQGKVTAAFDEHELAWKLDELEAILAAERIAAEASPTLLDAIRFFVHEHGPLAPGDGLQSERLNGLGQMARHD